MKVTYDAAADAVYVRLSKGGGSVTTKQVDKDILIDFNGKGQLIGIEVLSASERLSLSELEPAAVKLDTHWTTLSETLRAQKARGCPIVASKQRESYQVKEVGLDYVTLQDERRETRKVTARQLLVGQPDDALIDTLRALGRYPENQQEVTTR